MGHLRTAVFGLVCVAIVTTTLATLAQDAAARGLAASHGARREPAVAPIRRIGSPGPLAHGPNRSFGTSVTAANWAGYDVTGGGFTRVAASWVQPAALASSPSGSDTAFWVGLDGDGSTTVEQIGTEAYMQDGAVHYDAWYEMYPADMHVIADVTVSPGDLFSAAVAANGAGGFTLTLDDETTRVSFSKTLGNDVTDPASTEVVAEAPTGASTGDLLPLCDFGTVAFSGCAFDGEPIAAFDWNRIEMVAGSGATLAAASTLGTDGASFSVSEPPILTSFDPPSGSAGDSVTLRGAGFTDATAVSFDGTPASYSVSSDTQITATVPDSATSGPITVTTPVGATSSASDFTVTALSGDDVLSALTVSAGSLSPSFSPTTYSYSDAVPASATAISLTANTDSDHATCELEVDGVAVADPIGLAPGDNTIDVVVSAPNGDRRTYAVTVERTPSPAPTTTVRGAGGWHDKAVTLVFTATDHSGSGVASTEYQLDSGPWTQGTTLTVAAPADHTNDGLHTVRFYSIDNDGDTEATHSCSVGIDTRPPKVVADWATTVRRGQVASLRYLIDDPRPGSPTASVKIRIATAKGRDVKTLRVARAAVDARLATRFRCNLAKGSYRFFVYATDAAGNVQSRVGSERLTVD
jgi:hypothetical protein